MKIKIKDAYNAAVIFECEADSLNEAVKKAVRENISLKYADLSGLNLSGSNLSNADLSGSNLSGSNLSNADLSGSNLSDAHLSYSNLSGSNLSGSNLSDTDLSHADLSGSNLSYTDLSSPNLSDANLSGADLSYADLSRADLSGVNLSGVNLSDANFSRADLSSSTLSYADLSEIKTDYFSVLSIAKDEVLSFYNLVLEGKINGRVYEGDCVCLVGSIANIRKENHEKLTIDLKPESTRPIEQFFAAIRRGDTPETNPVSAIVKNWTEEFMKENGINF